MKTLALLTLLLVSSGGDSISRQCASTTAQALANALNRSYEQALDEVLPDDPSTRVKIKKAALYHFATIKIVKPECVQSQ